MRFSRLLEGRFQNMLLQVRVRCERLLSAPNAKMCLLQHRSLRAAIRCGQRESPVGTPMLSFGRIVLTCGRAGFGGAGSAKHGTKS